MNKYYACADLHGRLDLWEKISEYCDDTDKIIFLGDAVDRGPDGMKLAAMLLADPRVIYLKGNHEEMFTNAAEKLIKDDSAWDWDIHQWIQNGGAPTYEVFMSMSDNDKIHYVNKLKSLKIWAEYRNKNDQYIFMCHSGNNHCFDSTIPVKEEDLLWDRTHFTIPFNINEREFNKKRFLIHGHTPTVYVAKALRLDSTEVRGKILRYNDGHKIDIDTAAYSTGITALLDLDTLEPIYFKVD